MTAFITKIGCQGTRTADVAHQFKFLDAHNFF